MSGIAILDVVIGLIFVYLLLSLFCTVANEIIANLTKLRSKNLEKGLRSIFADNPALLEAFKSHPKFRALIHPKVAPPKPKEKSKDAPRHVEAQAKKSGAAEMGGGEDNKEKPKRTWLKIQHSLPSYLSSATFAEVVSDVAKVAKGDGGERLPSLKEAIGEIENEDAKKWLLAVVNDAEASVADAKEELERWFDEVMERATGWYRKEIRRIGFGVACAVVLIFNADTINMAKRFWSDEVLRDAVVKMAEKTTGECTAESIEKATGKCPAVAMARSFSTSTDAVSLPLGWSSANLPNHGEEKRFEWKVGSIFGWILWLLGLYFSILAVSLGAPFWFDVLKKAIAVRNSGFLPKADDPKKKQGTA